MKNTKTALAWWLVDQTQIDEQILGYDSLGWKSVRHQSIILLLFSCIITAVFIIAKNASLYVISDIILMLLLCFFMFKGSKTSFLLAIIYWTFNKGSAMYDNPDRIMMSLIWWWIYMGPFYLGYQVEKARAKLKSIE